jgi:nucleotide-binding universal stress UspA family protein
MINDPLQDFKRILIPVDGSKISENALRYGVSIANKYNAGIILVSVFSPNDLESPFKKRIKEMKPELAKDVEKMPLIFLMENYHGILKNAISKRKIEVKSVLRQESTSARSVIEVLFDVIEKEKIDLVIISSHGKSGFKKLKLGSVTDGLIRSLGIPVICIRE